MSKKNIRQEAMNVYVNKKEGNQMKRAEIIENKPYGVTEYEGATYILLQDAYPSYSEGQHPKYEATAIREDEQPNEYDELTVYRIIWDVDAEYVVWDDETRWSLKADAPEDESCLCDWDEASNVQADGVMDADGWIH